MSGIRVAETIVGIVRFDVTIRGVDGAEIDAGMLTAPLRAGAKDGKLQVEPLDLREAFAEALDTTTDPAITAWAQSNINRTEN